MVGTHKNLVDYFAVQCGLFLKCTALSVLLLSACGQQSPSPGSQASAPQQSPSPESQTSVPPPENNTAYLESIAVDARKEMCRKYNDECQGFSLSTRNPTLTAADQANGIQEISIITVNYIVRHYPNHPWENTQSCYFFKKTTSGDIRYHSVAEVCCRGHQGTDNCPSSSADTLVPAPLSSAWCKPIPEKSRSQVSIRALEGHGDAVTIEIEDNGAIVKGTGSIGRGDVAGTSVLLRDPTLVMGKVPSWLTVSEGEQARLLVEFTTADGVEWAEDIPLPDYFWRALSGAATENQIIFRPVFEKSGGSRKGDPFDLNCTVQRDAAPDRFTAAGNSVRDAQTGLTWAAQDNGSDIDWNAAGNYCATLGGGWALPTMAELQGLYDESGTLRQSCEGWNCKVTPTIRLTSHGFWSGESYDSSEAWFVSLTDDHRQLSPVVNAGIRALCVRRS